MARANPGPGAAAKQLDARTRAGIFVGLSVLGILLVAAADHWAHPMPVELVTALCSAAVAGAAAFALVTPHRAAATAALTLALVAGIGLYQPAQDKISVAASKISTWVDGVRHGDGRK